MKIKKTIIALLIWLVLQLLGGIPMAVGQTGLLGSSCDLSFLLAIGLLASQVIEVLIFWGLKYFKPSEIVRPAPGWKVVLISLPLGFCTLYAIDLLALPVNVPDLLEDILKDLSGSFTGFLSIALIGPISEEIMMRRIILTEMKEATGSKWGGILISAAIFAIIHLNPAQVLFAFPAGILLGWLYCKTGSLLVPVLVHILNNSVSFLLTSLNLEDTVTTLADPLAITELAICVTVAVSLIVVLNRHYRENVQES